MKSIRTVLVAVFPFLRLPAAPLRGLLLSIAVGLAAVWFGIMRPAIDGGTILSIVVVIGAFVMADRVLALYYSSLRPLDVIGMDA